MRNQSNKPYMCGSTARVLSLPKIVWMLWLQGWSQAPDIVRACLQTWKYHNPGWEIHALTNSSIPEFLDVTEVLSPIAGKPVQHEALSDVIRIALLERYGGVWADATVYCLKPLDAWLPEKLSSGFFAFAKPVPDRMLSSWFFAASKGHYIVQQWRKLTCEYWAIRNERDHYFWFHHLFEQGYRSDPLFKTLWDATPETSADGPHYYVPYDQKLSRPATAIDQLLINNASVPLLKLSHKLRPNKYQSNSVLRTLCDRAAQLVSVHNERESPRP
jgi:hypothetical protein